MDSSFNGDLLEILGQYGSYRYNEKKRKEKRRCFRLFVGSRGHDEPHICGLVVARAVLFLFFCLPFNVGMFEGCQRSAGCQLEIRTLVGPSLPLEERIRCIVSTVGLSDAMAVSRWCATLQSLCLRYSNFDLPQQYSIPSPAVSGWHLGDFLKR